MNNDDRLKWTLLKKKKDDQNHYKMMTGINDEQIK